MKRSLLVLFISLLISASITVFAADSRSLIVGEFDASSKKERREIAKDLLSLIEKLASYLATPKPSEIAWVNKETVAIDKLRGTDAWRERITQFYESPEFQQQKLKSLLDNIKTGLQCVNNDKVNLKSEILCWAVASHNLSDKSTLDDSIMILKRNGRLPKDIADKAGLFEVTGYSARYDWYARGINQYIVIPYLSGRISK